MLKLAYWPILALTLALAGCGGGGGGAPAPTSGTSSTPPSNVVVIAPGAGSGGSTSTSGSTATGQPQPVNLTGLSYPQGVAVYGSTLYVANTSGASISAISLTPPNYTFTTIQLNYASGTSHLTQPTGLAVSSDGSVLYAADWHGFIDAIALVPGSNSANVTPLTSGLNNPDGLALSADGNSLFVANHGSINDVMQIPLNGGTPTTYSTLNTYAYSVYADATNVYATALNSTTNTNVVLQWQLGAPAYPKILTNQLPGASGITGTSTNGAIYVADYVAKSINKVDTTSGAIPATSSVSPYQPFLLAHDSTYLYFTDGNSGSVNAIPLP